MRQRFHNTLRAAGLCALGLMPAMAGAATLTSSDPRLQFDTRVDLGDTCHEWLRLRIDLTGDGQPYKLDFRYGNGCPYYRFTKVRASVSGLDQFGSLDVPDTVAPVLAGEPFEPFTRTEEFQISFVDNGTPEFGFIDLQIIQIPLPASAAGLGAALLGLLAFRRRPT